MGKHVYIGVKGSVVCLDKCSGEELWRTKLKGVHFVTICVDDDVIIAHTSGHLFGIDKESGDKIWENELSGLGYGIASISTFGSGDLEALAAQITQQRAAAGAAGGGAAGGGSG